MTNGATVGMAPWYGPWYGPWYEAAEGYQTPGRGVG